MEEVLTAPAVMIVIFAGVLLLAGLAYWIYSAVYQKRLDRALKEDAPAGAPAPEPRRAGKLILWLAVAVLVAGLLYRAAVLQSRLENLELSMRNDMENLASRIDDNYQELIEQLRLENSLFLRSDYEILETDLARQTIRVAFTAVPKEAAEDAAVSLRCSGRTIPLTRQADGSFSAEFELGFSELPENDTALLCLTENGVERNEQIELWLGSWRDAFPQVDVVHSGEITEGSERLYLDLTVDTFLFSPKSQLRSLTLLAQDDSGELLGEKDLMPELTEDDPTVGAYEACTDFSGDYPKGQEVRFLVRYEDVGGLSCEILFARLDPEGWLADEWTERFLDADGALIWERVGIEY